MRDVVEDFVWHDRQVWRKRQAYKGARREKVYVVTVYVKDKKVKMALYMQNIPCHIVSSFPSYLASLDTAVQYMKSLRASAGLG